MSEKANRAPSQTWPTKPVGEYPQVYVETRSDDQIAIVRYETSGSVAQVITLPRKEARMLARRVNQCLDGTRR